MATEHDIFYECIFYAKDMGLSFYTRENMIEVHKRLCILMEVPYQSEYHAKMKIHLESMLAFYHVFLNGEFMQSPKIATYCNFELSVH